MVEGVLSFVAVQSAEAEEKIKATAAQNPPERVRDFAVALRPIMDLPGVESAAARPIGEVIDFLKSSVAVREASRAKPAKGPTDAAPPAGNALAQLVREDALADQDAKLAPPHVPGEDFRRIRTSTVVPAADSKGAACDGPLAAAKGGTCAKVAVFPGPFVLTDLYAPGGCGDELFVYSDADSSRSWTILNGANQSMSLHGAQLVVAREEKLYVGARTEKGALRGDALRCSITFSGWRPEFPGVHYLMLE